MGAVFERVSSLNASYDGDNRQSPPCRRRRRHRRRGRDHRENVPRPAEAHHNFNKGHWRRARFLSHPEVKLTMSVNASYYQAFRRSCPIIAQIAITAILIIIIHITSKALKSSGARARKCHKQNKIINHTQEPGTYGGHHQFQRQPTI